MIQCHPSSRYFPLSYLIQQFYANVLAHKAFPHDEEVVVSLTGIPEQMEIFRRYISTAFSKVHHRLEVSFPRNFVFQA